MVVPGSLAPVIIDGAAPAPKSPARAGDFGQLLDARSPGSAGVPPARSPRATAATPDEAGETPALPAAAALPETPAVADEAAIEAAEEAALLALLALFGIAPPPPPPTGDGTHAGGTTANVVPAAPDPAQAADDAEVAAARPTMTGAATDGLEVAPAPGSGNQPSADEAPPAPPPAALALALAALDGDESAAPRSGQQEQARANDAPPREAPKATAPATPAASSPLDPAITVVAASSAPATAAPVAATVAPAAAAPTAVATLGRVLEQTQAAIQGGQSSVRIRLEPESLGTVDLRIVARNGMLDIRLTAAEPGAREVLRGGLDHLRQGLAESGHQIQRIRVDTQITQPAAGDPRFGHPGQHSGGHSASDERAGAEWRRSFRLPGTLASEAGPASDSTASRVAAPAGVVDYRI